MLVTGSVDTVGFPFLQPVKNKITHAMKKALSIT
jgi:hypothetical protein